VEKIEFGIGDDDRQRLLNVIDAFQKFTSGLIGGESYFLPAFRDDYKHVWMELGPHFSALKDALQRADTGVLLAHGLLGNQLALKLKVTNHYTKEFFLYGVELIGGHKLLDKALHAIGLLLSDMVAATGNGQAILSFKDFLQAGIKDDG